MILRHHYSISASMLGSPPLIHSRSQDIELEAQFLKTLDPELGTHIVFSLLSSFAPELPGL